jgi:hypothetical protein
MEYDILYAGMNVCLINCFLERDRLTYGFGYFSGNTAPIINLRDGNGDFVVKVAIPDEIAMNPIIEAMGDAHDTNELKRIPS